MINITAFEHIINEINKDINLIIVFKNISIISLINYNKSYELILY
jgi:hypothetical protein